MRTIAYALATAATLAQLLPLLAIVPSWRRTTEVRKWIAIWCLVFFTSDLLQLAVSQTQGNNLWLFLVTNPFEDGIILWVLSLWQTRPVVRIAFRVAIPIVIVIYLVIAWTTGRSDTFQTFAGPFRALVILTATMFTLVSRISHEMEGIWNRDWLWTTLGVSAYYGLLVAAEPVAAALGTQNSAIRFGVWAVKAAGDVVAFVLIWQGMRCPIQPTYSGST